MNTTSQQRTAMTAKETRSPHLLSDAETLETLREMARDMQVALYRRYDTAEAVKILNIPKAELDSLRSRGEIAYILVGEGHVAFFGCQLLTYLLHCIVPVGTQPEPRTPLQPEHAPKPPKPSLHPEAELVSVKDTMAVLGIGRTKLYDLLNTAQLDCVKIGTRTLIRRSSIYRLMSAS